MIIKDAGKQWQSPPEGLFNAVCVDAVDMGLVETPWGSKHLLKLVWQLEERDDTGRRFLVSRKFTASLNVKSSLRTFLECWRGKKFSPEELSEGFDPEVLVGQGCQLQLVNVASDGGRTYASIMAALPMPKGAIRLTPENYTREKDRESERGTIPEDEVPF